MADTAFGPVRTLVVWCPDWPLTALGVGPEEPAVVIDGGLVRASSVSARACGVARGQRRRDAQARCPNLVVLESDEAREARRFEPVVAALGDITPWVETRRPGVCAFGVRGPRRLFDGEDHLVECTATTVVEALADVLGAGRPTCRVGVADGSFAAGLAARAAARAGMGSLVVPVGTTRTFLAVQPVVVLDRPELTDVLTRLGLVTLGAFAALPVGDVVGRFGAEGLAAYRLASGAGDRPSERRPVSGDLAVAVDLDPPADRVERVAFVARSLAQSFHDGLLRRGLSCTRMVIEAETAHGERLERRWRDEGPMGPLAVADRVRWQLEGWLHGPPSVRPTAGLTRLALVPDEVVPATGHQAGFWGGASAADGRAERGLTRVVGLLGPGAVRVPVWRGGRDPADQLVLVPFPSGPGREVAPPDDAPPWPGSLPAPAPAAVHADPAPAEVFDADGRMVRVDGRGRLSAPPAGLRLGDRAADPVLAVATWSGPWPVEERWWDPGRRRRRVRLQVVTTDDTARLVVLEDGCWRVGATYD